MLNDNLFEAKWNTLINKIANCPKRSFGKKAIKIRKGEYLSRGIDKYKKYNKLDYYVNNQIHYIHIRLYKDQIKEYLKTIGSDTILLNELQTELENIKFQERQLLHIKNNDINDEYDEDELGLTEIDYELEYIQNKKNHLRKQILSKKYEIKLLQYLHNFFYK